MKRSLLLAIAGLAASGCSGSSGQSYGDVIVHWTFSGVSSVTYTCAQGGVDYVVATFPGGELVDSARPTIPCVFAGVQGATFLGILAGPETIVITGYRQMGAMPNPVVDVALFTGQNSVNVVAGATNVVDVIAFSNNDDVFVYWHFTHLDSTGTNQALTCAQAGVTDVLIEFSDAYTAFVPCSQSGVEGVTVQNFAPGPYWVQVTGYRDLQPAALFYSGRVDFTKVAGVNAVVNVAAPGIPGNLEVFPTLTGWNGTAYVPYASPACVTGNVDFLTYTVKDGAGLTLAEGQVACNTDPPSILFTGASAIDKDDLAIRMQGWQTGTPAVMVMDSCSVAFPHFGDNDVAVLGAAIDLLYPIPAVCQ